MNIATLSTIAGFVTTIGGGGYWVATTYPTRDELNVVAVKTEFVMDKQMESMLAQINRLEGKSNKSPDDFEQLRYLRDELRRLRELRKGR